MTCRDPAPLRWPAPRRITCTQCQAAAGRRLAHWRPGSGVAFRANQREPGPTALQLIPRGELVTSLDRAAEARVTLISAPAGSGKTSLLRAWAAGPGRRHRLAVIQVQHDQQDAQQFWIALLSAVRQALGTSGEGEK